MTYFALQDLPNEILRRILSELSPLDLLYGWWGINNKFNQLILSLDYSICLKNSNVRADELQAILFFRQQVVSLVITKKWCRLIDQFTNLRALRIVGFVYPYSTSQIKAKSLPRLTHLEFMDEFEWDDFMSADNYHYARQIVRCHLRKLIATPTVPCQTLRSVKFICCTSEALASLLRLAPNLIHMDIGVYTPISFAGLKLVSIATTTEEDQYPSFTPTPIHHFESIYHANLRRVRIDFEPNTTLKWLDSFLSSIPNVTHFSLKIGRSYEVFSFTELYRIITERLPNLKQQNFHFEYCCLPMEFNLEQHRSIGPLFKTMIARKIKSGPMHLLCISVNRSKKTYNKDTS
jgi:hypothetical protein